MSLNLGYKSKSVTSEDSDESFIDNQYGDSDCFSGQDSESNKINYDLYE